MSGSEISMQKACENDVYTPSLMINVWHDAI